MLILFSHYLLKLHFLPIFIPLFNQSLSQSISLSLYIYIYINVYIYRLCRSLNISIEKYVHLLYFIPMLLSLSLSLSLTHTHTHTQTHTRTLSLSLSLYIYIYNVKLGGFRPQLQASYGSSHTEELWYNEILSEWQYIRSPTEVEHSEEGIYGCHSHNAKPFERIEHSGIR